MLSIQLRLSKQTSVCTSKLSKWFKIKNIERFI